jgi:hypothetical protein
MKFSLLSYIDDSAICYYLVGKSPLVTLTNFIR